MLNSLALWKMVGFFKENIIPVGYKQNKGNREGKEYTILQL